MDVVIGTVIGVVIAIGLVRFGKWLVVCFFRKDG